MEFLLGMAMSFNLHFAWAQQDPCKLLCNVDFEQDFLVPPGQFAFIHQSRVACWKTTATDQIIEIWGSGFGGVPAYSGGQFAELNANMVSTLYQNFTAAPGGSVRISFAHRGRAGIDVLSVEIGPTSGPYQSLGNFSAGNSAWVYNTVNFTFPDTGRTDYVIRFRSVSAAGGATVGNFLDAISIELQNPLIDDYTIQQPDCPQSTNGSISLNKIRGNSPFRFAWSPSLFPSDRNQVNLSPGHYVLTITDSYGCQATFEFPLEAKHERDTSLEVRSACDRYFWNASHSWLQQTGRYEQLIANVYGCDSLVILDLTIHPSSSKTDVVKACDRFTWPVNHREYNASGVYMEKYVDVHGCDSSLILDLTIHQPYHFVDTILACDDFVWHVNQKRYQRSGTYYERFSSSSACDSIHELMLTLVDSDTIREKAASCGSYYWPATKQRYTQSGEYIQHYFNQRGCDSLVILQLEVLPVFEHWDTVSVCEQYIWPINGKILHKSGIYHQKFQSIGGCDSTFALLLNVHATHEAIEMVDACDDFVWPVNGMHYVQSGTDQVMLQTQYGCDSLLILHLNIHRSCLHADTFESCEVYQWPVNGKTIDTSGMYTAHFQTSYGCDSVHTLNFTKHPDYRWVDTVTAIEYYRWPRNLELYQESGIYSITYRTNKSCDSIYLLFLEIRKRGTVWVPNAFTPNGDQVNDRLVVYASPEISIIDRFEIFNRWGELMFRMDDFAPNEQLLGWSGEYKGRKMSPGVFVYVVTWKDTEGIKRQTTGDASLFR